MRFFFSDFKEGGGKGTPYQKWKIRKTLLYYYPLLFKSEKLCYIIIHYYKLCYIPGISKMKKKGKEIGCKKITKIKRGVGYRRKDAV